MFKPSRMMPPRLGRNPPTPAGWMLLALLAGGLVWLVYSDVGVRWTLVALATLFAVGTVAVELHGRHVRRVRIGESVCSFVRALPFRDHDTWVIRAVYEEVISHARFPIRPEDRLTESIGYHPDDLDLAIFSVLERTGRSTRGLEANPMTGRVETVYDLIKYVEAQKKKGEPGATDNPDDAQRSREDH